MEKRTILITGGGRGLAQAAAKRLAGKHQHRIIVTARSEETCKALVQSFSKEKLEIEAIPLNLGDYADVKAFPGRLSDSGVGSIDVLVCSAAVMQQSETRLVTVNGKEETLQVNVLSYVLLVELLLPLLKKGTRARIVTLTSRLHFPDSRGLPVDYDFEDPFMEKPGAYNASRAYKNSKLATLWFTYELQRRLDANGIDIKVNTICPGFVPVTAAVSAKSLWTKFLLLCVIRFLPFATSVEAAADAYEFMILDPSLDSVKGAGFYTEKKKVESSLESNDQEKAKRFCAWAQDQVKQYLPSDDLTLF